MMARFGFPLVLLASVGLSGCGFGVPEMNVFSPDQNFDNTPFSTQGYFENDLVNHIKCGIERGLLRVAGYIGGKPVPFVDWLYKFENNTGWGTTVNLTLQVDEISSANPGASVTNQWGNEIKVLPLKQSAIYPQAFLFGAAGNLSAHSTRTETIQYTYSNEWLLARALEEREYAKLQGDPDGPSCDKGLDGFQIQSNLKIDDFIWDKATIAATGNAQSTQRSWATFGVFQDQLTFVASYGGSVTPTWKIETVVLGTNSPLLSGTRTNTDTLIMTMGPLDLSAANKPTRFTPLALKGGAQAQHQAAATGAAVAGSTSSVTH
jgi:hypothetical protein